MFDKRDDGVDYITAITNTMCIFYYFNPTKLQCGQFKLTIVNTKTIKLVGKVSLFLVH